MIRKSHLAFAALAVLSGTVLAGGAADAVTVVQPYVRLAPPNAPATGAFMVLKNGSDKEVRLVKAESAVAKSVELHNHINDGGVMKMRQVHAIAIKAKGETALEPGSYHVMLLGMKAALKEGDKVAITLGFEDGSSKQVDAVVSKPQAPKAAADHSMHGHKH